MRGLLADVNIQGHLAKIRYALEAIDLWDFLVAEQIRFETFVDHKLSPHLDDRRLWGFCQSNQLVLITNDKQRRPGFAPGYAR